MACRESTGYVQRRNEGSSFKQLFDGGCIEIRTGQQPATADLPATGTLIARVTRDGGVWAPGNPANGLIYDVDGRYAMKRFVHTWRLQGLAAGDAGWCRVVGVNGDSGGASLSEPRIDGAVGLIGAVTDVQMFLPVLSITPETVIDFNYWWLAPPPLPEY